MDIFNLGSVSVYILVMLNLVQHLVFRPRNEFGVTVKIENESLSQFDRDYNFNNIGMYWNAYANGGSTYNYIGTSAWGGTASRLVGTGNNLSYDQASGGTNPITWTNRLTINSSGNVGIGTANPNSNFKTDVNGDIRFSSSYGVLSAVTNGWTQIGSNFYESSGTQRISCDEFGACCSSENLV